MSESDSSSDSSFFSSSLGAAAAAPPAAAPPAAGAEPTPEPMLVISSPTLQPDRAEAKRPGQNGSTLTPAALINLFKLSALISRPSSWRMRAAYVQACSDILRCFCKFDLRL